MFYYQIWGLWIVCESRRVFRKIYFPCNLLIYENFMNEANCKDIFYYYYYYYLCSIGAKKAYRFGITWEYIIFVLGWTTPLILVPVLEDMLEENQNVLAWWSEWHYRNIHKMVRWHRLRPASTTGPLHRNRYMTLNTYTKPNIHFLSVRHGSTAAKSNE